MDVYLGMLPGFVHENGCCIKVSMKCCAKDSKLCKQIFTLGCNLDPSKRTVAVLKVNMKCCAKYSDLGKQIFTQGCNLDPSMRTAAGLKVNMKCCAKG